MSPSDLGQSLKPFVFLDLFDTEGAAFSGFGWHPHSGIATLTYLWEGSVRYEDTTGAAGFLPGGVEWFKAAGGAWHGGGAGKSGRSRGFHSGSPCRPNMNSGRPKASTRRRRTFARMGLPPFCSARLARCRARYGAILDQLSGGAPKGRRNLALRAARRSPRLLGRARLGKLAVPEPAGGRAGGFEPSNEAIDFHAEADTESVLGSAASHPYDLVLGNYSVHTSPASLQAGERRIAEIKVRLQKEGRL